MTILKQSLIFDEALRDSPFFKAYLKGYEDRIDAFEKNVTKMSQACEELSRAQSMVNAFREHFTSSFKSINDDLICDRVLKKTIEVFNDLIDTTCNELFTSLQEMRDHVLDTMVEIFKMHLQKIDDKKKQYYSRYDFFESNLVKGVSGGSGGGPFNDRQSGSSSDSTANSRIAFKHSALEVAKVFNLLRVEFREQILNSFPRLVKCVRGFSQKLNEKMRQVKPEIETITALISCALIEYKEEKEYINCKYELCRKKCVARTGVEDNNNPYATMVIAPPLPYITSCNIIILQGYLLKQPHTKFGPWSRRWFYLVDDRLLYYRTKESDFKIVTDCLNKSWLIRAKKDDKKQNVLELQGPSDQYSSSNSNNNHLTSLASSSGGKHTSMLLQAESRAESSLWQDVIFATIQNSSSKSTSTQRSNSYLINSSSELVLVDTLIKPDFNYATTIEEMARYEDNKFCCDCMSLDPTWGVTSLGITVCSRCAQVHRTLIRCPSRKSNNNNGRQTQVARVLHLTLDEWRPEVAALMKLLGNRMVNSIYESCRTDELDKPKFDSDMATREKWITGKYFERRFVRALSDSNSFDPSNRLFSVIKSESCDVTLVLQLISQGADVNWRSEQNENKTALHNATFGGKLSCCELLIQQGGEVDAIDDLGRTPLHYACLNGNRMVACLLLNNGADPHVLDSEEKTPMDVATDAQERDLLCVLKISQALRRFQPAEIDSSRFASSDVSSFDLSRTPTNPTTYRDVSSSSRNGGNR